MTRIPVITERNGTEFAVAFQKGGSSSTVSKIELEIEVLIFVEGGKPENSEKNPRNSDENQQQTHPTCDAIVCITEPKYRIGRLSNNNQFYAHNTQMFRAHAKAHTSLLAFSLTGETPTHEQIAVQNILYLFY